MVKPQILDVPGSGRMIAAGGIIVKSNLPSQKYTYPQGTKPSESLMSSYEFAPAGDNNDMFEKLLTDAGRNTILTPGIRFKSEMIYGGGTSLRKISSDENKQRKTTEIYHPEFENFLRKTKFHESLMATTVDLVGLGSGYYQISLNTKGDKILLCTSHNTRCRNTRLGWKDERGRITAAYINADFGRSTETQTKTKKLTLIDTTFDPSEWLKKYISDGGSARHFIYPIQHISLGADNYYPVPDWNTAREGKWLEVSFKIAQLKNYLIDNIIKIKLMIEPHPDYWSMRFGSEQWSGWSESEQIDKMIEEATRLDNFFKGIEGGTALMAQQLANTFDKDPISSLKITEFKHQFTDGLHIEDSQEAAANILFALGLHTSLFGSGSSKGLGNSGSENKYAFNQRKGLVGFTRQQLLSPLNMIIDFNGWGENLEPFIRDTADLKSDSAIPPSQRENQIPD